MFSLFLLLRLPTMTKLSPISPLLLAFSLTLFLPCYASSSTAAYGEMTWTNNLHSLDQLRAQYEDWRLVRTVLITENISYTNDMNKRYGCGFFCYGLNCDTFLFATFLVIYDISDGELFALEMVWSANRNRVVHENATLLLTSAGNLLLRDADGTFVWSTNTSSDSFKGMMIQDSGNLELFNSSNGTLWQSFDYPTDTIIFGQKFKVGQKLVANISPTNTSEGIFYAALFSLSFSMFITGSSSPQTYMRYPKNPTNVSIAYIILGNQSTFYYPEEGSQPIPALTVYQTLNALFFRIDSDGHAPTYSFGLKTGISSVDYTSSFTDGTTECDFPTNCGEYGICTDGQCSCPKGANGGVSFTPIDETKPNSGCRPPNPLVCSETYPIRDAQFLELEHVSYFTYSWENASIQELVSRDFCKSLCLKNCSCKAAFFRYDGNYSDGYCYLESKVYSVKMITNPSDRFYNSTAYIKFKPSSKGRNYTIVVISVGALGGVLLLVIFLWVWLRRFRKAGEAEEEETEDSMDFPYAVPYRYSFKDLEKATNHFKTKLGSGGFGSVYEGVLSDGTKVAVKRLDRAGQGTKEFRAEVQTLGNIHHFNLVKLKGFCAEKSHRMLVYEYLPNGSLDKWIFPHNNQSESLGWRTRKKVALHIARGLAYLHEECEERIIHFDIKPQNILVDEYFNAKVADFGLSKLIQRDQSEVITKIRGTPGYMAPELLDLHITEKADIYSFGVVLIEIVTGKRRSAQVNSFSALQQRAEEERLIELVDSHLKQEGIDAEKEALRMIELGIWCMQEDFARRPAMSTIVKALERMADLEDLPSFLLQSSRR